MPLEMAFLLGIVFSSALLDIQGQKMVLRFLGTVTYEHRLINSKTNLAQLRKLR